MLGELPVGMQVQWGAAPSNSKPMHLVLFGWCAGVLAVAKARGDERTAMAAGIVVPSKLLREKIELDLEAILESKK